MDSLACGADRFGHLGARLTFRLWSRRSSYVKRLKGLLVCLALTLAGRYALGQSATGDVAGQRWWSHIQFLADDNLEGRDVGSRGYKKASDYMAEQFRAVGLQPAGTEGYHQPMDFYVVRIDETRCSLDLLGGGKAQAVKLGDDAVLGVNWHAAENVEASAVFVGYGLTVPELNYGRFGRPGREGKNRGVCYRWPCGHVRPDQSALPIG